MAVIGVGNWGKNLLRCFQSMDAVDVKLVCDASQKARNKLYAKADVPICDKVEDVLGRKDIAAVAIATNSPTHYDVARRALEAGKHVFVEKPLTLASHEAEVLIQRAAEQDRRLMVGHLLMYHPAVNYIRTLLAEKALGSPLYLYCQRLNLGVVRTEENAWWSLAPHDISVACYLFDSTPLSVSVTGNAYLQSGIEDVVFATLQFPEGKIVHIHASWLDPHKTRCMTLVGSEKMVVFDDMESREKVRVFDKGVNSTSGTDFVGSLTLRQGDTLIPSLSTGEPLLEECEHFVHSVVTNTAPRSDGADGLRVVKVLEAGNQSLQKGGTPIAIT